MKVNYFAARSSEMTTARYRCNTACQRIEEEHSNTFQCKNENDILNNHQKSDWCFELMKFDDLDAITELIVDCYFEPSTTEFLVAMRQEIRLLFEPVCRVINFVQRSTFSEQVKFGIITRAKQRFFKPSWSLTKESLILTVFERLSHTLAGTVEIFPTGRSAYVCNLAVNKSMRRRGLARQLCLICEKVALYSWRKSKITLLVENSNSAAIHLYKSLNYVLVATLDDIGLGNIREKDSNLLAYTKQLMNKFLQSFVFY